MADVFTIEKRAEIMRKVRSDGNKSTELKLITIFKKNKIKGWRRNYKLFGKPDFVFPKNKIAIFLDGCFWHGHDCRNTKPKNNKIYWESKINRNQTRDRLVWETLIARNWKVIRIWECELRHPLETVKEIVQILDS